MFVEEKRDDVFEWIGNFTDSTVWVTVETGNIYIVFLYNSRSEKIRQVESIFFYVGGWMLSWKYMKTFKITWPDFSFKLALLRLPTQNENLSLKLNYLSNMIHRFQYKETGNVPSPNNFFEK